MTATIIKFPWRNLPITVPPDHVCASTIILPVVRVERHPDKPRRSRRRKLPSLNLAALRT